MSKLSSGGASTSPKSTNDEGDTKMSPAIKINLSEMMKNYRVWRETKRGKGRGKHRKIGDGKCKFERERKGKGNWKRGELRKEGTVWSECIAEENKNAQKRCVFYYEK